MTLSFDTKWKRDIIPKPLLCIIQYRGNKMEISMKNLLVNFRSGNFRFTRLV